MCQLKNIIALIILSFSISGPSFALDDLPKQNEIIKDSYKVFGDGILGDGFLRSIPLPTGDWIVVNARDYRSRNTSLNITFVPLREIILAQVDKNNQLVAAMVLVTNLDQRSWNYHAEFCKDLDNNFLYSNSYGTALWQQRCTSLSSVPYLQSSSSEAKEVQQFYNSRGIKFPSNAIKVHISKFDQMGNMVRIEIFYFPNTYGLENPYTTNLESSPWSKNIVENDPIKVKFINGLKEWSEKYSALMLENFDGQNKISKDISLYKFQN